jgi:hypothetical protein
MSEERNLARLEAIVDDAGIAATIESILPARGRPRQLPARTLLMGMLLAQTEGRPAHLTRVHQALVGLSSGERERLRVEVDWRSGPHTLTYRQVERTFTLVVDALAKDTPDGSPSEALGTIVENLLEASVPAEHKQASSSLAVDWTDHETFACPPTEPGGPCADPEASWGHRRGDSPGQRDELFFGYYPQAVTMVAEEHGPSVPELVRRLLVTSCHIDPPPALVAVLQRMHSAGIAIGDVLADSAYAHRAAHRWAAPLRRLGATLSQDLHPSDRGPKGTHAGAIIANGNLFCPATSPFLFDIAPLARGATPDATSAHDARCAEANHYKLGPISAHDSDGYHRVECPALAGKLRCRLRSASMTLPYDRPEILHPPDHPPCCCTQQTLTVPPSINAKTAQKHDYPGPRWRHSYARRTGAERTFATTKDPATNDAGRRGWCRMTGLSAITLFLTALYVVRNQRIVDAFETRRNDNARRAAAGRAPRVRRRRRRTLDDLLDTS